jgi:hypothetical protein
MDHIRKTVDSGDLAHIFELPPSLRNKRVDVIILPVEPTDTDPPEPPALKERPIGFMKGPPLPDSFFDPLPEEDLQAWGL